MLGSLHCDLLHSIHSVTNKLDIYNQWADLWNYTFVYDFRNQAIYRTYQKAYNSGRHWFISQPWVWNVCCGKQTVCLQGRQCVYRADNVSTGQTVCLHGQCVYTADSVSTRQTACLPGSQCVYMAVSMPTQHVYTAHSVSTRQTVCLHGSQGAYTAHSVPTRQTALLQDTQVFARRRVNTSTRWLRWMGSRWPYSDSTAGNASPISEIPSWWHLDRSLSRHLLS